MLESTKLELVNLCENGNAQQKNFAVRLQEIYNNYALNSSKIEYIANLKKYETDLVGKKMPPDEKAKFLNLCHQMLHNIK